MHGLPTVATFRSWRGSVARIAQNLLAGNKKSGERGIRTLDTIADIHPFQGCTFDHSDISPGRSVALSKSGVSEREGFEPSVPENQYTGFRVQLLRPLGHLSRRLTLYETEKIRTSDPQFRKLVLYPAELQSHHVKNQSGEAGIRTPEPVTRLTP